MVEKDKNKVVVQTTIKEDVINSIIPSIKEVERFIIFLNKKFGLGLPNDIIINIQQTNPKTKGFFMPKGHKESYQNGKGKLNYICLSSIHLKNFPYETIAHETAHFYNDFKGIKDCSSNQYHNKRFKEVAEMLLLKVDKGKGYSQTSETEEFKDLLKEFKINDNAFKIFQNSKERKQKDNSRNLLYMCSCGVKVRTARNEEKPFNAICEYCKTKFVRVE